MKKTALALALLAATGASQALVTYTGSVDQGVTAADDDFAPGAEVLFGREVTVDEYVSVQMTAPPPLCSSTHLYSNSTGQFHQVLVERRFPGYRAAST